MKNLARGLLAPGMAVLCLASCGTTRFVDPPGTVSSTGNPLVAQYSMNVLPGAKMAVEFGTDTTYGRQTWYQPAPPGGGVVNMLVAGMLASTTYHMRGRIRYPDGTESLDSDHTFATGSVSPSVLPPIAVSQPGGSTPSPGVELMDLDGGGTNQLHAIAVDTQGNLVWFYDFGLAEAGDAPFPMKLLPNGHILMVVSGPSSDNGYREIDLAGNLIQEVTKATLTQRLAAGGFSLIEAGLHHDILPLPNGHIIVLVFEQRIFTDLPGYPGQTAVQGDALIDVDPNGNPVWTWSAFDHLDVNRHPMQFPDWTHANAVIYSPDDGNLIVSLRHQYWVLKIDYRDGQGNGDVLWRLGPGGDFTLTNGGPADWNYGQHYPVLLSDRSAGSFPLAVFDNGNNRPADANGDPCDGSTLPCYSRPVVFQLDESAKTATILWQDKLPIFSFCCGNVDLLPNGNMEFDIAAYSTSPTWTSVVQEVTYTDSPQLVWQMTITGQNAYRATRLPSLYPGVQW
ncbi:MAG TPA: aryl-sulfate sulfotransferase [Candidatus Acidoferrum sp.]|nr:aryl-sulfate sulfotransferase [Candidatus Acidoferrum sp.]